MAKEIGGNGLKVNSEHCRHKQFNATWNLNGEDKAQSLFDMIRATHQHQPEHVISAYSDNAAVIFGTDHASYLAPTGSSRQWTSTTEPVHHLIKVETHVRPAPVN